MKKIKFTLLLLAVLKVTSFAQYDQFEPEYNWYTIEGEHVYVHFHEGTERTAKVIAKIGDEVWGPLTSLYGYEPEKVHYVIKDKDDYSNGATYFFDNKIEIWASALDFDLRGTHNWLRNVISHEFTHMVQIQAGMKWGRSLPAVYLQFLNYQDVRRPDLLYGYPDKIISYPFASINIPAWFAEGTAQYMRKEFGYENWDSHRDMILRSYVLDDNMLSWNEMGVFGKTSLGNESVYNSGFALTSYISQKYGEDKLRLITQKLGKFSNFTIDAAFEEVLGKDGNEIYDEWKKYLTKDYTERIKDVKNNLVQGTLIQDGSFGNFYPIYSKDGNKFYFISNEGQDYLSVSSLYEFDLATKKKKKLISGIRSTVSITPDGKNVIFAKLSEDNPEWANIHDLFIYNIADEDDTRLTFGLRANNPNLSHDGKKITFVFQKDGTTNLGIVDIDGKNFKRLTFFEEGEQVYNPKFSNDDSSIVFDYSIKEGRDIAKVNVDGSQFGFILQTKDDERNPVYDYDGNLIYSSNETGIFNLYKIDKLTQKRTQLSNVLGSAFMPTVDSTGNIIYAGYNSHGYQIYKLDADEQSNVDDSKKYVWTANPPIGNDKPNGDIDNFNLNHLANYDDTKVEYPVKPYSAFFSKMTFFPFIRFDNYNLTNDPLDKVKPGVYIASSDYLNRYSVFGAFAINKRMERDIFVGLEYRNKLPLLYSLGIKPVIMLDLYSVSRKANVDLYFGQYEDSTGIHYDNIVGTDVTYNLFEVDLALKHKIFATGNNIELRFIYSDYVARLGSFSLPNNLGLYPATKDTYFIGRSIQLTYWHKILMPYMDSDINPIGRDVMFQVNYENDKYNNEGNYEIENGILVPQYDNYSFFKAELDWKEHIAINKYNHTITGRLKAGSILGGEVPTFFDYYVGGLVGMKGYPFYAIGGNQSYWFHLSYRLPVFRNIDSRFGPWYLDKIFMSVYADIGDAWTGKFAGMDASKKAAGAEIRVKMNSFYLFPTAIFVNVAYGFDKFSTVVREKDITYGKEFLFYAGVLFDFSL
ncbi:MAG: biopolymer transporter Tol [Bacteroidetes bacterium]|nr:biopolymer transporter Tol [Bacteroidota bacterium]MBU1115388.1 biopolymer transporter Tol [Bacteroidota bacterium]MBU1797909.1 biopolymer transporter Tol [Bacteroidota bacterium]